MKTGMDYRIKFWLAISLAQFSLAAQKENTRYYDGGSQDSIVIDWNTPVSKLLKAFEMKWELLSTGQMNHIGYTDEMFSIAARKDSAISPVVEFIKSAKTLEAKMGGLYTLHLIGINSRSYYRADYEEFTNLQARKALLLFLNDETLRELIVWLLKRDPWFIDVPYYLEALKRCDSACWPLVNALLRYNITSLPINQKIPDSTFNKEITLEPSEENHDVNKKYDAFNENEILLKRVLNKIKGLNSGAISVEEELFKSGLLGVHTIPIPTKQRKKRVAKVKIGVVAERMTEVDFLLLGSQIQYYVDNNGKLNLCTIKTAKQRIVSWWGNLPDEDKKPFNVEKPVLR